MRFLKIVLIVAVLYVLTLIGFYCFQELFIFQASALPDDYEFQIDHPFEEVFLDSEDGARLHGVLLKSANSKGVILYFHGNRKSIIRWGDIAAYFLQYDYDVLLMDYRGYGKSKGIRTEQALHQDAELAYNYLVEKYNNQHIIIYGRSLGSGIAARLASKVEAKALILETPYHNFGDMLFDRLKLLPSKRLINYHFDSENSVQSVSYPIYIFHGTSDFVVPLKYGQRLAKSIDPRLLTSTIIKNGSHNDLNEFDEYNEVMRIAL